MPWCRCLSCRLTAVFCTGSYHPSEIVLGNALAALSEERPRESYKLISKCGRYNSEGFDYSPANIETSIRRSLGRLQTSYLDVVCAPPPPHLSTRDPLRHVFGPSDDQRLIWLRLPLPLGE